MYLGFLISYINKVALIMRMSIKKRQITGWQLPLNQLFILEHA